MRAYILMTRQKRNMGHHGSVLHSHPFTPYFVVPSPLTAVVFCVSFEVRGDTLAQVQERQEQGRGFLSTQRAGLGLCFQRQPREKPIGEFRIFRLEVAVVGVIFSPQCSSPAVVKHSRENMHGHGMALALFHVSERPWLAHVRVTCNINWYLRFSCAVCFLVST